MRGRLIAAWVLSLLASVGAGTLTEIKLPAPPAEPSSLLWLTDRTLLDAMGGDAALLTVGDEKGVEKNIALIGRSKTTGKWTREMVKASVVPRGASTDDSEDICQKDGYLYVVGSHFGPKGGPLSKKRQFIARFREVELPAKAVQIEVCLDGFRLHRAINDALKQCPVPPIPRTQGEIQAFVTQTQKELFKQEPGWADRVKDGDWPINIEGATFLASGSLLLGLRYPVTQNGQPILVELANVDALFERPDEKPAITGVWVIENVGSADELTGIRGLTRVNDTIHALTGNIDSDKPGKRTVLLDEHPSGMTADSAHYAFSAPQAGVNRVQARLVRRFKSRDVEGVTFDPAGRAFYIRDVSDSVNILHE